MSNIKLKLGYTQYVKRCNTEKAYAIRYGKYDNDMIFISRKYSTLSEVISKKNNRVSFDRYEIEFPLWLYDRLTDNQKQSIKLIIEENEQDNQGEQD